VSVPYFSEGRITVTQPLLQGRTRLENRDAIDDAERRIAAAEHELAQTREELALEVVRTFYDVVKAEELQAVAEKSLDRVGALRKVAEGKLELGAVSKMDVFRADLHATRLKNALVEQKARRDASLDTLKLLLDVDPRIALEIDARVQGPSADAYDAERAEEAALERRIELVEARDEVANAERKLLLARYRVWPALDLVGFYAKQGFGNDFRDSTTLDRQEWNVGLQSSVPLQRTVEQAAVAEAEIVLRGRERDYRQIRAEVVRQARDAYRQLDRARAAQVLAGDIADQASEQAELARFRYEKGVTDNFDLVQSEVQLAEARSGTAIAAIDTAIAAAELHRVAGTLAERFGTPAGAASEPLPDEDAAGEDPGEDR
jgi:outer membrane protein TolC